MEFPVKIEDLQEIKNEPLDEGYGIKCENFEFDDGPTTSSSSQVAPEFSRFLAAQGVPFENIQSSSARKFMDILGVDAPESLSNVASNSDEEIDFQNVGSMSVTLDITDTIDNEKFAVFSIHYYDSQNLRQNAVFLRKLMSNEVTLDAILELLVEIVGPMPPDFRFKNIVAPSDTTTLLFRGVGSIERGYICFHFFMQKFVDRLLCIERMSSLRTLIDFVNALRNNHIACKEFKTIMVSLGQDTSLPVLRRGSWQNIERFLARALPLTPIFRHIELKMYRVYNVIMPMAIHKGNAGPSQLEYLQSILRECARFSRSMSTPNSSISQVIPTVTALGKYIQGRISDKDQEFEQAFTDSFHHLTVEPVCDRYEIATLLDPRYGYRLDIFDVLHWRRIEEKLIQVFIEMTNRNEAEFLLQVYTMSVADRIALIEAELTEYHAAVPHLDESESPFEWWAQLNPNMHSLTVLAREFLGSPAVSIDANYFFGEGGKFTHLVHCYNYQQLDDYLRVAGHAQEFRGKGAGFEESNPALQIPKNFGLILEQDKPVPLVKAPVEKASKVTSKTKSRPQKKEMKTSEREVDGSTCRMVLCNVCNKKELSSSMERIQLGSPEALLMVVAAVYRGEMNQHNARQCSIMLCQSSKEPRFACPIHFVEACDDVMDLLGVPSPEMVNDIKPDSKNVVALMDEMQRVQFGDNPMNSELLLCHVRGYLKQYYVPIQKPSQTTPRVRCCYCKSRVVPNDVCALPEKLRGRYGTPKDADSFLCRAHFPDENFHRRGRMMKVVLPKPKHML